MRFLVDDVLFPDFFEQSFCGHWGFNSRDQ
jgi:hypothetical protein